VVHVAVLSGQYNLVNDIFNDILLIFRTVKAFKKRFGPYDAMNSLFGLLSDCADGKTLLFGLSQALITRGNIFHDGSHGRIVAICACLYQGNPEVKAHLIYVISSLDVVKSVDDDVELTHEVVAKVVLLNTTFQALDSDGRILCGNCFLETS
jgi:hypothetical protein